MNFVGNTIQSVAESYFVLISFGLVDLAMFPIVI